MQSSRHRQLSRSILDNFYETQFSTLTIIYLKLFTKFCPYEREKEKNHLEKRAGKNLEPIELQVSKTRQLSTTAVASNNDPTSDVSSGSCREGTAEWFLSGVRRLSRRRGENEESGGTDNARFFLE